MSRITKLPPPAPIVAVRFCGTGGQGLVLMGKLLAEAAAIHAGLNVVQTKSYGPEARGGASRSDVVLSSGDIDDLGGLATDILVCLSQQACDKFYPDMAPQGVLLTDSSNVGVVPTSRAVELPITATAQDVCKNKMVANVVGLGALCGLTQIVPFSALEAAVRAAVKPAFHELNLQALKAGYDLAQSDRRVVPGSAIARTWDFGYLHPHAQPAKPAKAKAKPAAKPASQLVAEAKAKAKAKP